MNLRTRTCILVGLMVASSGAPSPAKPPENTIIVKQPDSPIEITTYKARYLRGGQLSIEGINHDLTYLNRADRNVVAVSFGLVSFDVFNRFLGKSDGISMDDLDVGKSKKGSWVSRPYADFSFLTGVAYVELVRTADGTIWRVDESTVLEEMRKIQKDFDAKLLTEREGGPSK